MIADARMRFDALRSTRPRTEPCRAIVLHWTGGAGGAEQVYRTLRGRTGPTTPDGLSIHFVVEPDGTAVQMASLDLVCLHVSPWQGVPVNAVSVGIEVVSPGIAHGAVYERELRAGVKRDAYALRLRGARRAVRVLDYTEAQHATVRRLVDSIGARFGIPCEIPRERDNAIMDRSMTAAELAAFTGVMGHFHAHASKLDPGLRPLARLVDL